MEKGMWNWNIKFFNETIMFFFRKLSGNLQFKSYENCMIFGYFPAEIQSTLSKETVLSTKENELLNFLICSGNFLEVH